MKGDSNMTKKIRILSFLLALVIFMTSVNISVFAAETVTTISVEHKKALVGEEIEVNVTIQNNPGILGMTLEIDYNENLTLTNAVSGEAFSHLTMTKPGNFNTPCRFIWDGQECDEEDIKDGTILTLTFTADENVEIEKAMTVSVSTPGGDVYDNNLNYVDVTTVDGSVTMVDFKAGDANGDKQINITDIILVRRYLVGGYNADINENAANVNDDGKVNTADIITLRRYIAGGYKDANGDPLKLLYPTVLKCEHDMDEVAYKAPTCTEEGNIAHWYCMNCHKYFSDKYGNQEIVWEDTVIEANGHTVVVVPGKDPTYDEGGYTESKYCSVCNEVLEESTLLEPIPKDWYAIEYHISDNDTYLQSQVITNPNPTQYASQDGLPLEGLIVPGYNFKGWFTAQIGGEQVTEIAAGSTGKKILYAQWEEVVYDVIFDSPDVPTASVTYTVSKGVTITNPSKFGYTFIGWSNDDGFIVSRIKPGTIGNITLHANWTSNRNKATSYSIYGEPIIIEDDINGQFLFVYDIGKIDNVPLEQVGDGWNSQGTTIDNESTFTNTITEEQAKTIAKTIANTTTRSSGWTLSEEWDQIYEAGSEYSESQVKSEERTDSEGNTVGGKYFVSNSEGGASYVSTESGGSNSTSSKITTDTSKGINYSYDNSTETYADAKLGVENTTEVGAGVEVPVGVAKVSAEVKNTTTVSAEVSSGRKDNTAYHFDGSASSYVGTVDTNGASTSFNVATNDSSTWNSTTGFEESYETSRNTEVSKAISNEIAKTTSYNLTEALGGASSTNEVITGTDDKKDEYSTRVEYAEQISEATTKKVTQQSTATGNFRIVMAGTVHVYGVVGYDVATASYYTYTYNVLDDERHVLLDYSLEDPTFDDCENGLVTFDVPFDIYEYVSSVTGKTAGLQFNSSGVVTAYNYAEDEDFDGTVVLPQYYSTNNASDGTYSAYKTVGFTADVFKGKTNIKTVILPMYITEIPDHAFEGCTNLETVIAYGVTSIGENAFAGCNSLNKFVLDNKISYLGNNAFEGVGEIAVMASCPEVADAAINSGAKRVTLNLSKMEGSYDDKKIDISEDTAYFGLISNGTEYKNLQVESDAAETYISNVKFVNNIATPLKLSSETITLARVAVTDCAGYALVSTADHAEILLYDNITLQTTGENVAISKNVTLVQQDTSFDGNLILTGNYLVCGTVTDEKNLLSFVSGETISIDEATYESMLTSTTVTFNANGGTVEEESKVIYYGQNYGTLPTPTREYHTFLGWYTEAEGGTQITEDTIVEVLAPQTLYAHWELNVYTVEFDANEGTVDETSRIVPCGEALGTLPVPSRDYYTFNGWYTAAEGGELVTEESVYITAMNLKLYAQWSLNPSSGWVLASEVPADAVVLNQKWTYTLTTNKESCDTSMSGYTQVGSYWVHSGSGSVNYSTSFPSGFDTGHWIYTSFAKSPYSAYENTTNKRTVSNNWAGYVYWHWMYDTNSANGSSVRAIYNKYGYGPTNNYLYKYFGAFTSTNGSYSSDTGYCNNLNIRNYIIPERTAYSDCQGATRWFRFDYYTSSYNDYYKMFQYRKVENKESSTEVFASNTISNVQKWVEYRAK